MLKCGFRWNKDGKDSEASDNSADCGVVELPAVMDAPAQPRENTHYCIPVISDRQTESLALILNPLNFEQVEETHTEAHTDIKKLTPKAHGKIHQDTTSKTVKPLRCKAFRR